MANDEEEEVACPVCGKSVGLDVSSCPYCGAEFEEEEESEEPAPAEVKAAKAKPTKAQPAKAQPVKSDEEEDVACPVCGVMVGVDISSCPRCGAEFEEEEIEEVIEVEEKASFEDEEPAPAPAKPKAKAKPAKKMEAEEEELAGEAPASILDLRVIGIALIILGLIGTQVALFIDWYWSWVPPIEDNMVLFVMIPVIILVVGLLVFLLVRKAVSGGKKVPEMAPGTSLSLFLFGILALIVVVLWDPINSALQDSKALVAGGFAIALVLGIVLVFLGFRGASAKASSD